MAIPGPMSFLGGLGISGPRSLRGGGGEVREYVLEELGLSADT